MFDNQLNFTQAKRLVDIEPTEAEKRSFISKMEQDETISAEVGASLRADIDWNKPRPIGEIADEVANGQRI